MAEQRGDDWGVLAGAWWYPAVGGEPARRVRWTTHLRWPVALCIDLAIAKTNKYASRESGDTAEVVERPGGGVSVVVADGQGSGRAAKTLSLTVTSKAVALLKEGVRDGATARAVHDALFLFRHGQVSATLDIVSVDLQAETLVVTRNGSTPLLIRADGRWTEREPKHGPIGLYPLTKPDLVRLPLVAGLAAVVATDGIFGAGVRLGLPRFDPAAFLAAQPVELDAARLADGLLAAAVAHDGGKPADDMTVAVVRIGEHDDAVLVRRMTAHLPLP